jgi:hypothetical protein
MAFSARTPDVPLTANSGYWPASDGISKIGSKADVPFVGGGFWRQFVFRETQITPRFCSPSMPTWLRFDLAGD